MHEHNVRVLMCFKRARAGWGENLPDMSQGVEPFLDRSKYTADCNNALSGVCRWCVQSCVPARAGFTCRR